MGKWDWKSKALEVSNKCLCFLSKIPFCCGVWEQVVFWMMPMDRKKFSL